MIGRLVSSTVTLVVGTAIAAGLFWGFLSTPESTTGALILSALIVLAIVVVVAIGGGVAILGWTGTDGLGSRLRVAIRHVPAVIPPALLVLAVWWLTSTATIWLADHSGEISAWAIARWGVGDISRALSAAEWLLRWLALVVAPLVAVAWWSDLLRNSMTPTPASMRQAFSPITLLVATVVVAVFVWVPWMRMVPWRPAVVSGGTTEVIFVGAKLGLATLLTAMGVSLCIRAAVRRA